MYGNYWKIPWSYMEHPSARSCGGYNLYTPTSGWVPQSLHDEGCHGKELKHLTMCITCECEAVHEFVSEKSKMEVLDYWDWWDDLGTLGRAKWKIIRAWRKAKSK